MKTSHCNKCGALIESSLAIYGFGVRCKCASKEFTKKKRELAASEEDVNVLCQKLSECQQQRDKATKVLEDVSEVYHSLSKDYQVMDGIIINVDAILKELSAIPLPDSE